MLPSRFLRTRVMTFATFMLVGSFAACAPESATPKYANPFDEMEEAAVVERVAQAGDLAASVEYLSGGNPEIKAALERAVAAKDGIPEEIRVSAFVGRAHILHRQYAEHETATEYFESGQALEAMGQSEAALTQYQRAAAKDPKHDMAWAGVGRAAKNLGKYEEAVAAFERALAVAQDRPGWLVELGETYYTQGNVDQARELFERALEVKPGFTKAYDKLAVVHWKKGDTQAAWDLLLKSLKAGGTPDPGFLAMIRKEMQATDEVLREQLGLEPGAPLPRAVAPLATGEASGTE